MKDATVYIIFKPEDLDALRRVLDRSVPADGHEIERAAQAVTLINLFKGGLRTENALSAALNGSGGPHGDVADRDFKRMLP